MSETLRLFIGIEVGEVWTEALILAADQIRETLERGGRWVRPELYHVTVLFLGNQPAEVVDQIAAALASTTTAFEPFSLLLREVVRFGRHEQGALVAAV